jgi:L-threonylcarbamoyladenylate synthase
LKKKRKKLNHSSKIRLINWKSPETRILNEAAEIIRAGGIIIFPTRGLYGLAADANNPIAISKIFTVKNRPSAKPLLVLIKNQEALEPLVQNIPPEARQLMKEFWPGKLTIIFPARQTLSPILTGNTGKIGVRLPGYPVALALAELLDNPITGTSANVSGQPGIADIRNLDSTILDKVDLVLDAGPLLGGTGSTIVDITQKKCHIIRQGLISQEQIFAVLNKPDEFVRSPDLHFPKTSA